MKLEKEHSSSRHQRAVRDRTVMIPRQTYGNSKLTHSKCKKHRSKGELSLRNLVQKARKGEKRRSCKVQKDSKEEVICREGDKVRV